MLRIIVGDRGFNDSTQEFVTINPVVLDLEHSLVSLSKWESEYQKPFLSTKEHTREEIWGYIRAMLVSPDVDPEVLEKISIEDLEKIQAYIDSPQSATTFAEMPGRKNSREVITSELIYYWMVAFNVPFETETWHLNRLFNLIRICGIKNSKPEKMSTTEAAAQRAKINEERRKRFGTRG